MSPATSLMTMNKDPAIKLFGKTIPFASPMNEKNGRERDECCEIEKCKIPVVTGEGDNKEAHRETSKEAEGAKSFAEEPTTADLTFSASKSPIMENKSMEDNKPEEEDKVDTNTDGQDKILKKPDKIVPCPRCNSFDTKFCYYNNYNVNQPRHFCKNCQRYWTAGGTMRNVPIGAGRRKNKIVSSQYRQLLMTSAPDPSAVKFNPGAAPLCDSMATVLNLGEQNNTPGEIRDEPSSCVSSVTATSTSREITLPENVPQTEHGAIPWLYPCYPGTQWAYHQNMSIPFPYAPPSYWAWAAGSWNMPWGNPNGCISPSSSTTSNSGCSGNGSPTLGKHPRDTNLFAEKKPDKAEKCFWVPKTLRVNDPKDAAKSSIWTTLGIKPSDRSESITKGGTFKAFQCKSNVVAQDLDAVQALQANPAAFSRSQSFQESS